MTTKKEQWNEDQFSFVYVPARLWKSGTLSCSAAKQAKYRMLMRRRCERNEV